MEIKKDRHSNLNYSLHDAHVRQITIENNKITLGFDYIFEPAVNKAYSYEMRKADIIFTGDFSCEVYVFSNVVGRGGKKRFSGKNFYLENFVKKYKEIDFEIITECYHGYKTIFEGWLYINKNPVTCIMSFWNDGDIIYRIYDDEKI